MPNPTTLVQAANLAKSLHLAARQQARIDLGAAHAALAAAREALEEKSAELSELEKRVAAKRAQLAAAEVPANAAALVAELATLQTQVRARQAQVLDLSDAIAGHEAAAAAASDALARAEARLAAADAELAAAGTTAARRSAWATAATSGALGALRGAGGDADDALTGATFAAARTRLQAAIPAELLAAASAGFIAEAARIEGQEASLAVAEEVLAQQYEAKEGLEGAVKGARIRLEQAERVLREWVERGRERYDRALVLLAEVAPLPPPAVTPPLLTTAEAARLAELGGGSGTSDEAATLRATRSQRRAAADVAQAEYDDARLAARAPDVTVDDATIDAVTDVADAQATLTAAIGQRTTAETAYDATQHARYAAWAAALPEAVWRGVLGFLEAERTLTQLRAVDAQQLVDDVAAAELALAGALADRVRGEVTLAFLEAEVEAREARLARARASRQLRLLGAVRGDA